MTPTVRIAEAADLASAARTLKSAFKDYPWTRWVIPEEVYEERLYDLQRIYLEHALKHGVVMTTKDFGGAIALLPADAPAPDQTIMDQIVNLHGDRIDRISQSPTNPGTWTLETIGVRADHQGRGHGSALIAHGVREAIAQGAKAVNLETSDIRNVRLYERNGFRVTQHTETIDGPPTWHMEFNIGPAHKAVPPAPTAPNCR
ncbi:MAG: GNAT family N-acetyltransferase [Brevibacterium aurantiacum]